MRFDFQVDSLRRTLQLDNKELTPGLRICGDFAGKQEINDALGSIVSDYGSLLLGLSVRRAKLLKLLPQHSIEILIAIRKQVFLAKDPCLAFEHSMKLSPLLQRLFQIGLK
ncbi:hypothetical protein CKO44_25685 [Rubrivivax gelatinosus]|nr:hypothetical protein [Rubrivivax gelatinosus]